MLRTQALELDGRLRLISPSVGGPVLLALLVLKAAGATGSGALDPDFWWHLRYAMDMFATDVLPAVDSYSWTFEGRGYAITQWAGQYVMGLAYLVGGTVATSMLTAVVIAAIVFFAWKTARLYMGSSTLALLVALFATQAFWDITARPQMFGFALFAMLVYFIARWEAERSTRLLVAVPLISALWVNVHGSYVLGLLYVVALAIREIARCSHLGPLPAVRNNLALLLVVLLSVLATLLNPHGPGAWSYVLEIMNFETTRGNIISEWLPTNIGFPAGQAFLLVSIGTLVALVLSRKKGSPIDVAEAVVLFAFGMITLRHTYFASIAFVPLMARAMAGTELLRLLDARVPERMPAWMALALLAVVAAVTPGLHRSSAALVSAEVAKRYPVAAMQFLDNNKVTGRLLNDVTAGGWIIFNSDRKVFIDGRLDLYRDQHFFEWFFARQGAPMWREFIRRWQPDIVLMQNQTPIRQLLLLSGAWVLVHEDISFSVLLRDAPEYSGLIQRYRREPAPWAPLDANGRRIVQPLGW